MSIKKYWYSNGKVSIFYLSTSCYKTLTGKIAHSIQKMIYDPYGLKQFFTRGFIFKNIKKKKRFFSFCNVSRFLNMSICIYLEVFSILKKIGKNVKISYFLFFCSTVLYCQYLVVLSESTDPNCFIEKFKNLIQNSIALNFEKFLHY